MGTKGLGSYLKSQLLHCLPFSFSFQAYHGFTGKQKGNFYCKICQGFSFLSSPGHTTPGPLMILVAPTSPPLPQFPSDAGPCVLSQQVAVAGELVTVCHLLQDLGDRRKHSLQLQGFCLLDLLLPHTPIPLELLFLCPSQVTKLPVPQPPQPLSSPIPVLPAPSPVLSPANVLGEPWPAGLWAWSVPGAAVPTWGFSPALSPVLV